MLLTIHNLPSSTTYADVISLLQGKCSLADVVVDSLVSDGQNKKVNVEVASEDECASVITQLDGLFVNGQELYIEEILQPTTVVKMERDCENGAIKETEDTFRNSKQCKVEYDSLTTVKVKTEPVDPDSERTKCNIVNSSDFQIQTVKYEQAGEIIPSSSKNDFTNIPKKKRKKKPSPNDISKLNAQIKHTPFKEEKTTSEKEKRYLKYLNCKKEKYNQVRHCAARFIARRIMAIMGPNLNQCGEKHRIKCPGHGLEKFMFKRLKAVVFKRICDIYPDSLYTSNYPTNSQYIVNQYTIRFVDSDPLLYDQTLKEYKQPNPPKPKITYDTSHFPTLMPPDWQFQYTTDKLISEIKSQKDLE